jgi:hypothetical protein
VAVSGREPASRGRPLGSSRSSSPSSSALAAFFLVTFAQAAVDRGAPIEAVSRALRHESTKTTEAYYACIRAEGACAEIEEAFERPVRARA